jgi:hypothetical protein
VWDEERQCQTGQKGEGDEEKVEAVCVDIYRERQTQANNLLSPSPDCPSQPLPRHSGTVLIGSKIFQTQRSAKAELAILAIIHPMLVVEKHC